MATRKPFYQSAAPIPKFRSVAEHIVSVVSYKHIFTIYSMMLKNFCKDTKKMCTFAKKFAS